MSKFVLTAQLQLKAPANTQQVVSQMRRQLSGINVNVGVQGAPQAQRQVAKINQQVNKLNKSGARLGKTFGLAINRFAAFTVASRAVSLFTNGLANATREAIAFERELIKISQVTGKTIQELSGLNNTITQLSVNLGTSSKDLLATTRILAQAGIQARDLDVALAALAKTTLAPTFEDITKTAEGAVAILAQFGQGVGALERQLGAINAVAGQFAVESGDLISVVRRTGGVFKAAGGDLNELLGLFTSVRATTRESAESIATGLRTIFTRIQRPKTIEFLKQFGVELVDLNGKFVGPFEAVRQLSNALAGLGEGDIRFVQIAEELGGFRQIGKVIPLLQQFETAEKARQAALEGGDSLTRDAATAQQALAVQITKVKEEFLALVRSISQTGSFQTLVKTTLDLASALISVADALKPIIPLLGAFAGIKLARGLAGFGSGIGAALKGGPRGFNSGGLVPGTGNRDTVPAMLTPGEFVIRKSSVKKMGVGALAEMNGNKYNKGGSVAINPNSRDIKVLVNSRQNPGNTIPTAIPISEAKSANSPLKTFGANALAQAGITNLAFNSPLTVSGFNDDGLFDKSKKKVIDAGKKLVSELKAGVRGKTPNLDRQEDNIVTALNTSLGRAFEEYVGDIAQFDSPGNQNFDIPRGFGEGLRPYTAEPFDNDTLGEIKIRDTEANLSSVIKKAANEGMFNPFIRSRMTKDSKKGRGGRRNFFGGAIQKFALGGLALKNRVGFAILDPDRKAQDMDAKVTRAQIRSVVKGTDSQRKALDKELSWPNKNFKVARQGLNAKTSQRFYDTLSREAAQGVSVAAAGLSSDLGLGNITVPETSKQLMADSIRKSGSMMGKVFEDVVNVMDGRGKFSPSPPGAPFDFKGGLQGALKDNYDRLPSTFVDAKTSYGEATAGEAQKKIINELAQTYQQTPTYANSKKGDKRGESEKQAAARAQRTQKGQARLAKLREKAGFNMGGAAPSDTVPALLTPGEFVINKSAASKIGKANLDRMNKQGVKGFAAGGPVEFANGGGVNFGNITNSGINVAAAAQRRASNQSSGGGEVKKEAGLLARGLKSVTGATKDIPSNFKTAVQSVKLWDNATKTSAASVQSAGTTTSSALKNTGEEVKKADSRLVQGIKGIGERVRNSGDRLSQGFTKINTFVGNQAGNLTTAFNNITNTVNTKGGSTFRNFFSGIDKQTPTLQATFQKVSEGVSGSIKKITAPLDRSSGEIQKVATKLSSTAATVRTGALPQATGINFKGVNNTEQALTRFKSTLLKAGTEEHKATQLTAKFNQSLRSSKTVSDALKKTFAGTDISVKRLEKSTAKVAMAKEKEVVASNKAAAADANEAAKSGAGASGAAMGAFFAISSIATMIPQVEGVKEGFGAVQNTIGPLTMQLGALGMVATSFEGKLGKMVGALAISVGAVHLLNTVLDAYTGVHLKAKDAIEKGNIGQAGELAVSSQAQKDVNKFAMGLAATGTAIGALFGPGGAVVGAIVGGLAGLGAKVLAQMLPESVITGFRNNFLTAFGADSTALIAARATAAAALKRAELDAAKNAERAAAALKEVEAGSMSLADAFESGELTRDVKAYNLAVKKAIKVERIAAGEAEAASTTGRQAVATGGTALGGAAAGALTGALIGSFVPVIGTAVGAAVGGVIGAGGGAFFGSKADDQKKAEADKATEQTKQAMEALNASVKKLIPQFTQLGRNLFVEGKNFSDFTKSISESLGVNFSELDPSIQIQLAKNFKANAAAVAENTKAFAESNLGLRPLETLASGLNTSLNRITSVIEGKFNSLGSAVDIVGAALSGAEVDAATFDTALAQINSSFRQFGVSDIAISKLNKNFNALRTASGGFDEALNNLRDRLLSKGGLGEGVSVKDALIEEISNLEGLDEEGKRIVKNIFGNIDFTNDEINALREGDLSPILDKLDEAGKKAFEGVQKASEELVSAQNALVSITKKRAEAELKMIAAQKKAIGLQEEAAGILAELGGEKLSPTERAGFAQARLSADLRGGIGSDGSVGGILSRIGLIQSQAGAAAGRLSSVAGGAEGDTFQFAQDQQSLATANRELDALADFARKRVKIYQDELAIVQKKNSLEKSSLEKLISGDVTGFVEGQSAAAAQIALRSGNQSLANMFSSSSLGAAFSNLEGQGLSDSEKRAAASVALGPGFASDRNIGVLTGTTSEEKSIKDNIAEQASILRAIAPAINQLGSADFNIATAGLQKANDEFVNAQQRAAKASAEFAANQEKVNQKAAEQEQRAKEAGEAADKAIESAKKQRAEQEAGDKGGDKDIGINNATIEVENQVAGFARGGMVYASRGMFVPRGTDTVPAMLTPGEFVVNRAAVQRGNNLQVLKAMNGNGAAPAPAAEGMSNGGTVYRRRGGRIFGGQESGGMDMTAMFKTFESSAKVFSDAVNKLSGFKLNVQLDPTNVNVNLNGGTFLNQMKDSIKDELLAIVSERIRGASFDNTGDFNLDPVAQRIV